MDKKWEELGYRIEKDDCLEKLLIKNTKQWRENGEIKISFGKPMKMVDIIFYGEITGNLPCFLTLEELELIKEQMERL